MAGQLSVFAILNGFLGQQEFPPCSDFSLVSLAFDLVADSNTEKIYEFFPQIKATCLLENIGPIPGLPPIPITFIAGAKLPLVFESADFSSDVPVSLTLGEIGCDDVSLLNENFGDVGTALSGFCEDFDVPGVIAGAFAEADTEELAAELRELTGGPFEVQPLADTLLAEEAAFNANGFEILEEAEFLQVFGSLASQSLQIPFVEEFIGGDIVEQIQAFIESGFDLTAFLPFGDYGDNYEENRRLQDGEYDDEYGEPTEGIAVSTVFSILLLLINPDIFLGDEVFDIVGFFNSTIGEALTVLEVDQQIVQGLENAFGSDETIFELLESEAALVTLRGFELLTLVPLFVDDQEVLSGLAPFLTGVTVGDLIDLPSLSLGEILNDVEVDVETIGLIDSFLDLQASISEVLSALLNGDILDLVDIDLVSFLPPQVEPLLGLIFQGQVPTDPFEIVEGVLNFLIVRTQNLALDFSQPFPQESVETLQFVALFDPLVAETFEEISSGNITVGEFALLANLPVIEIPLNTQTITVFPSFVGLNSVITLEQAEVPGSSSFILPSLVVADGSVITIVLEANLNGATTEITLEVEFGFRLDVALGLIANLGGLLDIGLFNIDQPEDLAEVGTALGVCAASQFGLSVITAAPGFTLTNVNIELSSPNDQDLNDIFDGVLNDLYINFLPNLANNELKSLIEGLTFTSLVEGGAVACAENSVAANNAEDDDDLAALLLPIVGGVAALLVLILLVVFMAKGSKIKKTNSQKKKNILEGEQKQAVKADV